MSDVVELCWFILILFLRSFSNSSQFWDIVMKHVESKIDSKARRALNGLNFWSVLKSFKSCFVPLFGSTFNCPPKPQTCISAFGDRVCTTFRARKKACLVLLDEIFFFGGTMALTTLGPGHISANQQQKFVAFTPLYSPCHLKAPKTLFFSSFGVRKGKNGVTTNSGLVTFCETLPYSWLIGK